MKLYNVSLAEEEHIPQGSDISELALEQYRNFNKMEELISKTEVATQAIESLSDMSDLMTHNTQLTVISREAIDTTLNIIYRNLGVNKQYALSHEDISCESVVDNIADFLSRIWEKFKEFVHGIIEFFYGNIRSCSDRGSHAIAKTEDLSKKVKKMDKAGKFMKPGSSGSNNTSGGTSSSNTSSGSTSSSNSNVFYRTFIKPKFDREALYNHFPWSEHINKNTIKHLLQDYRNVSPKFINEVKDLIDVLKTSVDKTLEHIKNNEPIDIDSYSLDDIDIQIGSKQHPFINGEYYHLHITYDKSNGKPIGDFKTEKIDPSHTSDDLTITILSVAEYQDLIIEIGRLRKEWENVSKISYNTSEQLTDVLNNLEKEVESKLKDKTDNDSNLFRQLIKNLTATYTAMLKSLSMICIKLLKSITTAIEACNLYTDTGLKYINRGGVDYVD